ncbi:hypothetical protein HETIRDRAFT_435719 [Heterobasidion irregulare TC 32-1]|uniref:Uncharacterized protein n=1 Tax=Heterobasidion irregulare (strain TC 32-1) TaxID=747525 RepID=W4K0W3_HETIT|nr:uncharacterized protein HETIRDRAFT_411039 [Heterobasidion irregulare TC 32-1]ETW79344.1 hypothetical protein HETIRDRAFT_435719 [Heterobasidion irregulare TC 32-1]
MKRPSDGLHSRTLHKRPIFALCDVCLILQSLMLLRALVTGSDNRDKPYKDDGLPSDVGGSRASLVCCISASCCR